MEIINLCQKTFAAVTPFVMIFTIILLLFGFITLLVQFIKTKLYLQRRLSKKIPLPLRVKRMASDLNLIGKVDIVKDDAKFSFCYGLIKPRICISSSLMQSISDNQLQVVLLHESYHVKNYDPLKIILGQSISVMFFFIPVIGEIQRYHLFSKEIVADEMAIKNVNRHSLISVLSKILSADLPRFSGVATLANLEDLEKRILILSGKEVRTAFRPTFLGAFLSILAVIFSLIIVNTPVYADYSVAYCKAEKEAIMSQQLLYTPKDSSK